MFKDFDVTQINKDTKAVVFRIDFSSISINNADLLNKHLRRVSDELMAIGIKAIFIDDSIQVEPLTNEFLDCGNLKVIE